MTMRRTERELTDHTQIAAFLENEQILRVAFYDHGEVYIVPVNYGYTCTDGHDRFYFHGAKAGRKYELSQGGASVGFEIDGNYGLLAGETPCQYSAAFQSVIGTGTVCVLEDPEEKRQGLHCIMEQATQTADWHFDAAMVEAVAVFRLDVETMSCKVH